MNITLFNSDIHYQLFNDDCMNVMKNLQQQSKMVNHIITDPPYAISQNNNFHTMNNPRKGVDFGDWDWNFDPSAWLDLAYPLLDKNGSMIIFCSYRFISQITQKIEYLGGVVKDIMIWGVKSKNSKWIFNKPENKPYQRGFFQTPTLLGKERTAHPTQKPITLMREIIQIHSNENELIFDPFMGVGSTGVASVNLTRAFIGVEREKQWFDIAKQRLNCSVL